MKKINRLISYLLCFALVLSMIPPISLHTHATSEAAQQGPLKTLDAFWSEDVVVDNQLSEAVWKTDPLTIAGPPTNGEVSLSTLSTYRVGNESYYTVSGDGKSVAFSSANAVTGGYGLRGTFNVIDHSKDILLTQTVNIAQLPAGGNPHITNYNTLDLAGTVSDPQQRNGYDFWLCDYAADGTGSAVFCSLFIPFDSKYWPGGTYNGQQTLHLRVQGNDGTATTPIDLGKKVNEVFELAVLWKADGSVTISVDGVEKGNIANGTLSKTALLKDKDFGMRYQTNGNNAASFTVSDVSISTPNVPTQTTGTVQATWNKNGLTLGITSENATAISASINNNPATTISGSVAEIFISWEDAGITLTDYNQSVPVKVTLSNGTGVAVSDVMIATRISQVMEIFDLFKATTSGDFRYTAGTTIVDGAAIMDTSATTALFKRNDPVIDHSKNILLSQTLKIDALPTVSESSILLAHTGNVSCQNALTFWMNQSVASGTGTGLFCAIYSTGETNNLKMRILGFDESGTHIALLTVDLGKKLGETFRLSVLWNADDSASIYVDGEEKGAVDNATLTYTNGLGALITYYCFTTTSSKTIKAAISDIFLSHIGTGEETILAAIRESWSAAGPLAGYAGASQTGSITLPAAYQDTMLGDIPVSWQSSDPDIVSPAGIINNSALMEKTAVLSAWLGEEKLYEQEIIAAAKAIPVQNLSQYLATQATSIKLDGNPNEVDWVHRYYVIKAGNVPMGVVSAAYDRKGLYLGLEYIRATSATISVNSTSVNLDLVNGTSTLGTLVVGKNTAEVLLPWSDLGVTLTDYEQEIPMGMSLYSGADTAALPQLSLVITSQQANLLQPAPNQLYSEGLSVRHNSVLWDVTSSGPQVTSAFLRDRLLDHTKDILLVQNLCIDKLPAAAALDNSTQTVDVSEGYSFWIACGTETLYGFIYRPQDSDQLHLSFYNTVGSDSTDIALGKALGDSFTLGVLWRPDNNVTVYVDGIQTGTAENATLSNLSGVGTSHIYFRYYTRNRAPAVLSLAEAKLVRTMASSIMEQMATLFPAIDTANVVSDIPLPQVFSSQWLGDFPITWTSTNTDIISTSGKVTASWFLDSIITSKDITLTATSTKHNKQVLSQNVTVKKTSGSSSTIAEPTSPNRITAGYVWSSILIDGQPNEVGWSLNSHTLDSSNMLTGKFGVQWDKDNLYLAIKKNTASDAVTLSVNGYEITDGPAVSAGNYAEYSVPLSQLGISAAYGTEATITASIGSGSYTGTILLSDVSWFQADNEFRPFSASSKPTASYINGGTYTANSYHSGERLVDGYKLYSRYDSTGTANEGLTRVSVAYGSRMNWLPLGETQKNVHIEFDFLAHSMPVCDPVTDIGWNSTGSYSNYGFTWWNSKAEQGQSSSAIVLGIMNTKDGLMFCALRSNKAPYTKLLNCTVGQVIRIGTTWKTNGDLVVYVNGLEIANIEGVANVVPGLGHLLTCFNLTRNETAAASEADNLEISVTNLSLGHRVCPVDELLFTTIRGSNLTEDNITSALELPTVWVDSQLGQSASIVWTSSDETVISTSGKVMRPATGAKQVTLSATLDGVTKTFDLLVPGLNVSSGDVLVCLTDYDPVTGAGAITDKPLFSLDSTNNSVIIDLKSSQTITTVKLRDSDSFARLSKEFMSLWVSMDNITYTRIEDFKLLQSGQNWYLYDFQTTGRYIKVHCTYYDSGEATFTAPTAELITAYSETVFGSNGSVFTDSEEFTVSNSDTMPAYDHAWEIPKSQLSLTGSDNSIRVFLGDELLYHYTTANSLIVRIPVVNAGASVTLNILSGNSAAMDIANKEAVYEVTYGTREAWNVRGTVRWIFGPLKNGAILGITDGGKNNGLRKSFSYDGGRTWTSPTVIPETVGKFTGMGGIAYDETANALFIYGHLEADYSDDGVQHLHIIKSLDNGSTWTYTGTVQNPGALPLCTYTNAITLSTYDGTGPSVDMVFTTGVEQGGNKFGCASVYTTDAGATWQLSTVLESDAAVGHEDGLSEATVMELPDGQLVMLIRNQVVGVDTFAVSYSSDQGKSWTAPVDSTIYTPNTQPILFRYGENILLSWGGNNMYGPHSRLRTPFSVAVTYDDMQTFENIQDLYSKYSLQSMNIGSMNRITNQQVVITGDDTFLSCWMNLTNNQSEESNMLLRVENFYEYFYKTKNAYDSFENGSVKYEGWSVTGGNAAVCNEQASQGSYAMKLTDNAIVTRSIPYFQSGTISMDIYVDGTATFMLDLQSAYTKEAGKGSPLGLQVVDNIITFYGASEASGLTLQHGWNTLTFGLSLFGDAPAATISVNGCEAKVMPVNTKIGDYICYITPITTGTLYIDNVLVESTLDALNVRALATCDHAETHTVTVNATCTADGSKTVYCKVCGILVESQVLSSGGHKYVGGICQLCDNINSQVHSTPLNNLQAAGATKDNGTYTFRGENGWSSYEQTAYISNLAEVDHANDILLSQTLCFRDMPHMQANNANITNYTVLPNHVYTTYITATKDASANGSGSGIAFCVFFEDENSLSLRIQDDDTTAFNSNNPAPEPIRLGKSRNDTFTLSVLWTTNNTVVIYVDGMEVGRQENCEIKNTRRAPNNSVYLAIRTGKENEAYNFDFTVSNVQVSNCNPNITTFSGTNVQLNSILGVQFYTPIENGTVTVAVGNQAAQTIAAPYRVDVFAQDMMKPITAKLYTPEGQLLIAKTFNLTKYINAINSLEGQDENTKALATATLTYCQYAAIYKGNFDGISNELAVIPDGAFDGYDYPTSGPAGCSVNAYLEEACELRLYLPDSGYTVTVNGVPATLTRSGNYYICRTEEILPQNYNKEYTFSVLKDGDTEPVEVPLSVLAYLNKCLNGGVSLTENQRNLMTAMYHYYAAAKAYLGQ